MQQKRLEVMTPEVARIKRIQRTFKKVDGIEKEPRDNVVS
jgi:hypothetical protein